MNDGKSKRKKKNEQNNNDSNTNIRLKFESLKFNLLFNESENCLKIIYYTINLLPPSPIHY